MDKKTEKKQAADKEYMETARLYERKRALDCSREYFSRLKISLKDALREVERHEKSWEEVVADGAFPDGRPLPKGDLVNELVWCAGHVKQIDLHSDKAIRSAAKVAKAFDLDL